MKTNKDKFVGFVANAKFRLIQKHKTLTSLDSGEAFVEVKLLFYGYLELFGITSNVAGLEIPPPGCGLNTVTCTVPGTEISDAGIVAFNPITSPPSATSGTV